MTIFLEVEKREGGKLGALRKTGKIPGVVYGPKQETVTIALDKKSFEKVAEEAGESTILTLKGIPGDIEVLIHDVAFNSLKGGIEHVDLYAIEKGKELTTNVALEFEGEAPGVKLGGVLTKVLYEVEVTCKPADLPHSIVVDVSVLAEIDSQIHVKDLNVPSGVTINDEPDEVVATVIAVEEEAEEPADTTIDMDAIEVEEKGKAPEEEGAEEKK